jgi:hypothetical protein
MLVGRLLYRPIATQSTRCGASDGSLAPPRVKALAESQEVVLVLDGMELRREGAEVQEYLMRVKALDGELVNGYRSFNVLGIGEGGARGLLYYHLFSSEQPAGAPMGADSPRRLRLQHDAVLWTSLTSTRWQSASGVCPRPPPFQSAQDRH